MYIKKYWGSFIGGSDDSLNLVAFLEDQKQEEIPLSEIFAKIGLDKQNWDFRQTVEYLEFTHSNGVEMDDIKEELEHICNCKIDLLRLRKNLRSLISQRIEKDGIYA